MHGTGDPPPAASAVAMAPPPSPGGSSGERNSTRPPIGATASWRPPPARPSQAPAPRARGRNVRVVVALVWFALQAALVLTARRRVDGAFGFGFFDQSTSVKVALFREVEAEDGERERVRVEDGTWSARDAGGLVRSFAWSDRVRRPELARFDRDVAVRNGASATIANLQAALDDVALHVADDADTRRFLLDVTIHRSGHEPYLVHLASAERAIVRRPGR